MDLRHLWDEIDKHVPAGKNSWWSQHFKDSQCTIHHSYNHWVLQLENPDHMRRLVQSGDPTAVAVHAWVTKARLLGVTVEGWI